MALVPIDNIGAIGVIVDAPAHTLPPEAWSTAVNIRFIDGVAEKMEGQQAVFGTPTVAPHFLLPWNYTTERRWLYPSTVTIYQTNSTAHTNVTRYTSTPGDDDYTAKARPIWTGGVLHGVPVLNHDNETDYPQQWNEATSRFKDLDNWPVNTYCRSMKTYGNFLIACNITKSSNNFPYMVKWSHVADPGTVPDSWDETDATKLAGENTLAETEGHVVTSLPIASQNTIYKTDAIHQMDFVGGINVFGFHEVTSTTGAMNARCVAEFYKQHIVVGFEDIVLYDGFKVQSILRQKNRKLFYDVLHNDYKDQTVVVVNYATREVWIGFVSISSASLYLDRALVWNWELNTWSLKELPNISFMSFGQIVSDITTFDALTGTFDEQADTFNSLASSGVNTVLMSKAYSTNELIEANSGYTDKGTTFNSTLERTGLTVAGVDRQGNPKVDPSKVKFIRAVYPKLTAPTSVTLQISVGAQDSPNSPIIWEGPYDFNSGTDTKVDFMVSGKYIAIKFEDSGSLPWELSGYVLDLDVISEL